MNLHHGHVLDVLATLEPGSVQCCVTSPPYWGLRDYGTGGVDWGGDTECDHEWQTETRRGMSGGLTEKQITNAGSFHNTHEVGTCLKCGAWHGELGLEPTPELYVEHLVAVFRAVRRVLRDDGTLWLNLGDSYAAGCMTGKQGSNSSTGRNIGQGAGTTMPPRKAPPGLKPKDLVGIPWRVAFALQADGWWLRSDIIWSKPNPMPESVRDRPTRAHEYIFLLSKSARYYYDADAIAEPCQSGPSDIRKMLEQKNRIGGLTKTLDDPLAKASAATNIGQKRAVGDPSGRNRRSVWEITTAPFPEAHFATFPPKLPELCIKAGSAEQSCPECGAPWERVVERTTATALQNTGYTEACGARNDGDRPGSYVGAGVTTLRWQPSCECGCTDTVGSVVLDPFIGSGTVGLVAEKLGRRWVGIDANAEYLEIAKRRLAQPTLWVKEAP